MNKIKNNMSVKEITKHYLICALWAENIDNKSVSDISKSSLKKAKNDCMEFIEKAKGLLEKADISDEMIGHDFFLTRNHHGTGFWDRDEIPKEIREKLTKFAQTFPEVCVADGETVDIY